MAMARKYLVMDLESVAIDSADDFIEAPSAPANYKDAAKIAEYVAERKIELRSKAALDIDLARVVCIGYWPSEDAEPTTIVCKDEAEEAKALASLRPYLSDFERCLIGFNSIRYDWPLIIRRHAYLGLPVPHVNMDKYRTPNVDLWQRLSFNGALSAHGLRWYAKRLGLTELLATDPLADGGGDVAAAVAEGRWADVAAHCAVDVRLTHRLAQWQQVIA